MKFHSCKQNNTEFKVQTRKEQENQIIIVGTHIDLIVFIAKFRKRFGLHVQSTKYCFAVFNSSDASEFSHFGIRETIPQVCYFNLFFSLQLFIIVLYLQKIKKNNLISQY